MKKYLFIFLRALLEIVLAIILSPFIMFISIIMLCTSLYAAHIINEPMKEGVKGWLMLLESGINMNIDFIMNGLKESI